MTARSAALLTALALAACAAGAAAAAPAHNDPCHPAHTCPSDHHSYLWLDASGKQWDCARPGADERTTADAHEVVVDALPYFCHPAAREAPPVTRPSADDASPGPVSTAPPPARFPIGTARAELARLAVRLPEPMTGYSRAQFGSAWADVDGNGCDTRNDILRRDLRQIRFRPDSRCVVASGVLHDPYTGKVISFVRGVQTSSAVQIDHIVPLADAWRTGARHWSPALRLRYANDPYLLVAADGPANQQKSDADSSEWLPTWKPDRCQYVAQQVAVKARYHLWLTASEKRAIVVVLQRCS